MVIDITHPMVGWDPADSTFVAELSDIEKSRFEITNLCRRGAPIWAENPKTGKMIKFIRFKTDTDGEDVFGWWYRAVHNGRELRFLFIND
jgi:hypothetical protein